MEVRKDLTDKRQIARIIIATIFGIGVSLMLYGATLAILTNNPFSGIVYVWLGLVPTILTINMMAKMAGEKNS
jgi:hypothetical protein